jgi:hypothetical protein
LHHPFQFDGEEGDNDFDLLDEWENNNKVVKHKWKACYPNAFDYEFGNVDEANCYKKFLCESTRKKLTFFLHKIDTGNSNLSSKCHQRRLMTLSLCSSKMNGFTK